jgi:hypothetical protein
VFSLQKGKAFFKRLLPRNQPPEERGRGVPIKSEKQLRHRLKEFWIKGAAPSAPRRVFRETKSIEKLLIEVLEVIASFLPTSSAVLFVLSSRTVMWKLGTGTFKAINKPIETLPQAFFPSSPPYAKEQQHLMSFWREDQKELHNFLQLYDRDRPDSLYCHYCRKIHNPGKHDPGRWHPCSSTTVALLPHCYYPNNIYFNKLQYIMKRHRLGLDTTTQLSELSKTKTKRALSLDGSKYTRQISTLARIRYNKLLLRTQDWIIIPSNPKPQLPSGWNVQFCPHWEFLQRKAWERCSCYDHTGDQWRSCSCDEIERLISCKLSQPSCSCCSYVIRCKECPTEFQLDSRKIGKDKWALAFTIWKDLGECKDPFDPNCNWDRHRRKVNGQGLGTKANSKGQSINNVFERYEVGNGLSLENFQAMELK